MNSASQLLLAFYGDDFTGSTDALEFLSRAGIKTMLFIEPPTAEQLAAYPDLQAIGVAGMTRAMTPAEMEETLLPAFQKLKELNTAQVHYKVCSTFDSSPATGSIGKAIEIGAQVFKHRFVPLLVAAPALGRYCTFGNLFARLGIGSQGEIFRLDRHPSMSKHPVTPADEGDLRLHLAKQTDQKIGLINILDIVRPIEEIEEKLHELTEAGNGIILFDALYPEQMECIGSVLDNAADAGTLFSVGSSGIEMALGDHWKKQGITAPKTSWMPEEYTGPILVISGSCSPVTSGQIEWALENGFAEVALDTEALSDLNNIDSIIQKNITEATALIQSDKSVIVHTSKGSDDPRIAKTRREIGLQTALILGTALGRIARAIAAETKVRRVLVAGGDTSGYAARAMGIEAVEMIRPLAPGAPLCKVYAPGSPLDGLEINLKGGQVGAKDYFGMVAGQTELLKH